MLFKIRNQQNFSDEHCNIPNFKGILVPNYHQHLPPEHIFPNPRTLMLNLGHSQKNCIVTQDKFPLKEAYSAK